MNIVIIGPPGSGKGTQAKMLADRLGLFYFEAGDFSRKLAERNSRIREIVERGDLIPEEEMSNYVSSYLEEKVPLRDNILFDGYPRFIHQYIFLKKWFRAKNKKINKVVYLKVSTKELLKRLTGRRIDKKTHKVYNLVTNPPPKNIDPKKLYQRQDDKPDPIKERLKVFNKNTLPLINYLKKENLLIEVDGENMIKKVFDSIVSAL